MTKKKQKPIIPGIQINRGITKEQQERMVAGSQGYIAPGVWLDDDGEIHFALPEILAYMGIEHTPESEAWLREALAKELLQNTPNAVVIQHHIVEKEPQ
jgi:hypothetical protein